MFISTVGTVEIAKIKVGKTRMSRLYAKINLPEIKEHGIRLIWSAVV